MNSLKLLGMGFMFVGRNNEDLRVNKGGYFTIYTHMALKNDCFLYKK